MDVQSLWATIQDEHSTIEERNGAYGLLRLIAIQNETFPLAAINDDPKATAILQAAIQKDVALTTSRYKSDSEQATHMGPVAQDFRAAFGLGVDDKYIATVDADGVALAAIQGLNAKVEGQASTIGEQQREIAALRRMLMDLRSMIEVKAAMH